MEGGLQKRRRRSRGIRAGGGGRQGRPWWHLLATGASREHRVCEMVAGRSCADGGRSSSGGVEGARDGACTRLFCWEHVPVGQRLPGLSNPSWLHLAVSAEPWPLLDRAADQHSHPWHERRCSARARPDWRCRGGLRTEQLRRHMAEVRCHSTPCRLGRRHRVPRSTQRPSCHLGGTVRLATTRGASSG
jgi:hypothetical protein